MTRVPSLVLSLIAVGASGCVETPDPPSTIPPGHEVLHDLVRELPRAELRHETREVLPGDPTGRPLLRAGWSRPEMDRGRAASFSWATGEVTSLETTILRPRPLEVVADLRAFQAPAMGDQHITLEVGGRSLGARVVSSQLSRVRWDVPEDALAVAGSVTWTFRSSWSTSPREATGAADDRSLSAAWYRIAIVEPGDADAESFPPNVPRALPSGELFLPWNTEASFYVDLPEEAFLRYAEPRARGMGELEIHLSQDENEARTLQILSSGALEAGETPLPSGVLQLRFRAIGSGSETSNAGLVLPSLEILARPSERQPTREPTRGPRPDLVVFWVIDTLRADGVLTGGATDAEDGAGRSALRHLAAEGSTFTRALAQSSWTRASMGTIWTGLRPTEHGAYRRDRALATGVRPLASTLQEDGWTTAAVVTNPNLTPTFGFDRGFDHFEVLPESARAGEVVDRGFDWLDATTTASPRFLWLHPLEPHAPYDPPEIDRELHAPAVPRDIAQRSLSLLDDIQTGRRPADDELVAQLKALYAAEIASGDRELGRLIAGLETRGLWEKTLFVFLSDHGEEMGEHQNWQHGHSLFEESLRVPFVIRLPRDWPPAVPRIEDPVQHLDVLPTMLDLLDQRAAASLPGDSLAPSLYGRPVPGRALLHHLHLDGPERRAVEVEGWKLIQQVDDGRVTREQLYELSSDPEETVNVVDRFPVRKGFLASHFEDASRGLGPEDTVVEIDPELEEQLKALGYVQ